MNSPAAKPLDLNGVQKSMNPAAILEPDAQLMLQVRAGDSAAFADLLMRHRKGIVNFAYRMVRNQGVAEELAQEVFLRVYRSRASYEPTAKFTTWLYRIATHLTLNWIRDHAKDSRQETIDRDSVDGAPVYLRDSSPNAEQTLVKESGNAEIRSAVDALPDKQRIAVLMHKYQDMEYSQIAGVLNCSNSAVKSLLFRAYESLRARLAHLA